MRLDWVNYGEVVMAITMMGKEEFIRHLSALPDGANFYVGEVQARHDSSRSTTMESPWEPPQSFEVDVQVRWKNRP